MDAAVLQRIIDSDFDMPEGALASDLIGSLFCALASPDANLRENGLTVLCEWIERGCYEDTALVEIGAVAAENLSRGIGEVETDSVFLRAFSSLVLGTVIAVDEARYAGKIDGTPFLASDQVLDWLDQGLAYVCAEQDRRGYVEGKGWAHAAAHAADLFRAFARSHHVGRDGLVRIVQGIGDAVSEPAEWTFLHQEDDRLAAAVTAALRRGALHCGFVTTWIGGLADPSDGLPWVTTLEDRCRNNARMNVQSFLRSLYFQLLIGSREHDVAEDEWGPCPIEAVRGAIVDALRHMDANRFYRPAA
jgi:hypothetical protein